MSQYWEPGGRDERQRCAEEARVVESVRDVLLPRLIVLCNPSKLVDQVEGRLGHVLRKGFRTEGGPYDVG